MFPSPPNSNCDTPNLDSLLKRSSSFPPHQNPTSINPADLLFNFSSPFLDEHESPLNQIFSQNHDHTKPINLGKSKMEQQTLAPPHAEEIIPTPRLRRSLGAIPRRRAGKKDRHSKICTAQGIRDRRMRLSLQVARKFFDLQDMLGYDKASKTIEWLFNQSKKAINELVDDLHHQSSPPPPENNNNGEAKSESFVSECEEMSGIEETNSSNVVPTADADPLTSYRSNARELRDRARARARCRTREKMLVKLLHFSGDCFQPNPIDIGKMNSPFVGIDQDQDQNPNPNTEGIRVSPFEGASSSYNSIQQQLSDVGTIERFLGNSSSSISYYADPNSSSSGSFMEFLGSWDVLSSERTNCFHYSVTNQFSFAGNLTAEFP